VAGNPARIIKYRFSETVIHELLRINYALIKPGNLAEIGLDLYKSHETKEFSTALNQLAQLSEKQNDKLIEINGKFFENKLYPDPTHFNNENNYNLDRKKSIKIFFVGNSITLHTPSESIGWHISNGMAASSAEKDYAHILINNLKIKPSDCLIENFSELENKNLEETAIGKSLMKFFSKKKPKITIFQLGDNVTNGIQLNIFKNNIFKLATLAKKVNSRVFILSTWWESKEKDEVLLSICKKLSVNYIYIGDIFSSIDNKDRIIKEYAHSGVDNHPRDWGMKQISNRLYAAINSL
jgi:hypothetical protein